MRTTKGVSSMSRAAVANRAEIYAMLADDKAGRFGTIRLVRECL